MTDVSLTLLDRFIRLAQKSPSPFWVILAIFGTVLAVLAGAAKGLVRVSHKYSPDALFTKILWWLETFQISLLMVIMILGLSLFTFSGSVLTVKGVLFLRERIDQAIGKDEEE